MIEKLLQKYYGMPNYEPLNTHLIGEDLIRFHGYKNWSARESFPVFLAPDIPLLIPKNTTTDGLSGGKLVHLFIERWDGSGIPELVHDYLYRLGVVSRALADVIYLDLSLSLKEKKAFIKFYGVRAGGWKTYNEYRRAELEGEK